jgi:hypothetical protein
MKMLKRISMFVVHLAFTTLLQAQLKAEPTFTSCSIYFPSKTPGECTVSFRKVQEKIWHQAFTPVYDSINKEFRVSIVRLEENTQYEIRLEMLSKNLQKITKNAKFTTWSSDPKIGKALKISSFVTPASNAIELTGLKGKPDAWIKIGGDIVIDAQDVRNYAIRIEDCQYLIIEGVTIKGGHLHGILVNPTSSDIRIINCDISNWGRKPKTQKKNGEFLDIDGKNINNDGGITIDRAKNIVVERCYVHDPNGLSNAWRGIIQIGEFTGEKFSNTHPQGPNAVYIRQSAGGTVLRFNDFIGSQTHRYNDAVETSENGDINGGFNKDADIYGNIMAFGQDDGIELDGGQCNVRMFNNRIEQTLCGFSTAPNKKGPSYIFNNLVWNLGDFYGITGAGVKNGGGIEYSLGKQFLFNNTIISDGYGCMQGVGFGCGGPNCKREIFNALTRNNIFMITVPPDTISPKILSAGSNRPRTSTKKSSSIGDLYKLVTNSFDNDMIANNSFPDGKGTIIAAESSEMNGIFGIPSFTNEKNGIFTLDPSDKGIDRGIVVPNFCETYTGKAPDIGAIELGGSSLIPIRPISISADKYYLKIENGKPETITLNAGQIGGKHTFTVKKNEDMDWLTIEPVSGEVTNNSFTSIQLKAQKTNYMQKGMIFIRLDNGFSVPVSVF